MLAAMGRYLKPGQLVPLKSVWCPVYKKVPTHKGSGDQSLYMQWTSVDFLFAWAGEPCICIFYYVWVQLSIWSVFLNGYFVIFLGDVWSTCDLIRSKAPWGLKGFTTSPKKSHITIPCQMSQLQLQGLSDSPVSSAPNQISLLQQVWADWWLDQFVDGTFSKENPGAEEMVWAAFYTQLVALTGADALCIPP